MNDHDWDAIISANKERAKQRESRDLDAIDTFLKENAKQCGCGYEAFKFVHRVAFDFGLLNVPEFAKKAGVTTLAVRRYFGGDDIDESEESDKPDTEDETEAATPDATQILSQQIDLLERDSNNILERADRDCNNGVAYSVDQLHAINHQLSILTRMLAIHARNTLKGRED